MNYSAVKQKGTLDRSFTCIKVPFHKDSTHSDVLAKCIDQVYKNVIGSGSPTGVKNCIAYGKAPVNSNHCVVGERHR